MASACSPSSPDPIATPKSTPTPEPITACGDFERITLGDYMLNNNVWNKGEITDYEQCVWAYDEAMPTTIGWCWSWPGTSGQGEFTLSSYEIMVQ